MKQKLILIGGGGHCKSCIDVIEQEGRFEIAGILDMPENIGGDVLGYPIIGSDEMIVDLKNDYRNFFITIGQISDANSRIKIFKKLKEYKLILPVIISPKAYVSKHSSFAEGTIVMHKAMVNADANIGENCIINSKCLIEHDVHIGNNCHISTGALINGGVIIGDDTFIGSGSVISHYLKIAPKIIIGTVAVVTKNLTEPGTYVGIPAIKLK